MMNVTSMPDGRDGVISLPSPSRDELDLLKQVVLFSDEDAYALRKAWRVLADQSDDYLDVLLGLIAAHPRLLHALMGPNGEMSSGYIDAVRGRFRQWLVDTCRRPYDQDWLKRLYELPWPRDHAATSPLQPVLGFRYLAAFSYPLIATIRPFLAHKGHSVEDIERMHQAWVKSIILQVTLLSKAYTGDEW